MRYTSSALEVNNADSYTDLDVDGMIILKRI